MREMTISTASTGTGNPAVVSGRGRSQRADRSLLYLTEKATTIFGQSKMFCNTAAIIPRPMLIAMTQRITFRTVRPSGLTTLPHFGHELAF